jgi:hypothetical protein
MSSLRLKSWSKSYTGSEAWMSSGGGVSSFVFADLQTLLQNSATDTTWSSLHANFGLIRGHQLLRPKLHTPTALKLVVAV